MRLGVWPQLREDTCPIRSSLLLPVTSAVCAVTSFGFERFYALSKARNLGRGGVLGLSHRGARIGAGRHRAKDGSKSGDSFGT